MRNRIALQNLRLRLAIHADIVRQIAAGTQNNLNRVSKSGSRKLFRNNVVPCGTRA